MSHNDLYTHSSDQVTVLGWTCVSNQVLVYIYTHLFIYTHTQCLKGMGIYGGLCTELELLISCSPTQTIFRVLMCWFVLTQRLTAATVSAEIWVHSTGFKETVQFFLGQTHTHSHTNICWLALRVLLGKTQILFWPEILEVTKNNSLP